MPSLSDRYGRYGSFLFFNKNGKRVILRVSCQPSSQLHFQFSGADIPVIAILRSLHRPVHHHQFPRRLRCIVGHSVFLDGMYHVRGQQAVLWHSDRHLKKSQEKKLRVSPLEWNCCPGCCCIPRINLYNPMFVPALLSFMNNEPSGDSAGNSA